MLVQSFVKIFRKLWQARSQEFVMGEGAIAGPEGGAPSRRRPMGVWGRTQPPEARGSG